VFIVVVVVCFIMTQSGNFWIHARIPIRQKKGNESAKGRYITFRF